MGMQVHFNKYDLPEVANVSRGADRDRGTWFIDCYGMRVIANSVEGRTFWFDVGQRTERQMAQIKLLIAMRIPFTVS